ncbi:MAG: glutamate synthase subunit beta [Candidatus Omnitrophica bacterium]|nr:glutamate synthase subunit beta [Candidatus Omnitrophota bacterium]
MADIKGFLKFRREEIGYRPVAERIQDYREVALLPSPEHTRIQTARCMDCGIPFCHWACPLGNYIPEWNELVFRNRWYKAYQLLSQTNNFPEITGRLCPAFCEYACTLEINDEAVTIRENELAIAEFAFNKGWVKSLSPSKRTGKKVAIVGSGPAGLACADILNRYGHRIVVFEKEDDFGGLLRYGVPDFKLEKWVLDRRIERLRKEGIEFLANIAVGKEIKASKLLKEFGCLVLAGGCGVPRDLKIEGRDLKGICFSIDYLKQANKLVAGEERIKDESIYAQGKRVVVIGGGDTGSDCVGVANRQGAKRVIQIELLPKPPEKRTPACPWPKYPLLLKTSSSHQEGCERYWQVLTKKFLGREGKVKKLLCAKVEIERDNLGVCRVKEIPHTEFEIEADLVILALGFLHPQREGIVEELDLELDECGNVKTNPQFMTSRKSVFACGDMRRGQSLIVWAIAEGRACAYHIDNYLRL